MGISEQPQLSVIIATYNRRASLGRLLQSLQNTRLGNGNTFEVLVVDNASTDETARYLEEESRRWPSLRSLHEGTKGKNFALNRGIREARGEFLCFMDDDILLDQDWLENLVQDYQTSGYDALQPRVLPGKDPSGQSASPEKLYWYNIPIIDYGNALRDVRGLTGVIMSVRRRVVDKAGVFDERLPASGYEGDTELSRRIRAAGFSIGYTPHVIAYHELDPKRYGNGYARLSQYRKGLSRSLYRSDSIMLNVIPNLLVNLLRYLIYKCFIRTEKVYRTEKRIMKYWGYLVGRIQRGMGKEPWV
jgi:glycosyltransferase involved in cell wall biosynthesis